MSFTKNLYTAQSSIW